MTETVEKEIILKDTDIYLVDTYGEASKFYNLTSVAFVGGSIIKHGGQNPLEPARFGCKIIHGPYIQNFTEIYKLLNQNNLSSKFNNVNQLVKLVDQSFKQNQNYNNKAIKLKPHYAEAFKFEKTFPFSDIRNLLPDPPPYKPFYKNLKNALI